MTTAEKTEKAVPRLKQRYREEIKASLLRMPPGCSRSWHDGCVRRGTASTAPPRARRP